MKSSSLKVLCVFGTRPEPITLAPLILDMHCLLTLRFWLKPSPIL